MTYNLLELLRQRAAAVPDKLAFDYSTQADEHSRLTYGGLDARARAIAATLQDHHAAGERALVLCPSGLDFIAAMFGCFYAGVVAVPVHPPVHNRLMSRVASIVADVQASLVLTTADTQSGMREVLDGLTADRSMSWLAVDAVAPDAASDWITPDVAADAIAFVQYTSGSTSAPKGVVLSHRNLLANLETISRDAGLGDRTRVVSWLPLHHDMGLIGGVFGAAYFGGTSFLMPPSAFIQRPMAWLEAISRHRANISVGPNFGYELCVERSTPQERAALDLSHWVRAYCGAEPVRAATLERFASAFAPAGFRPETFHPVYGLAEATLLVSGNAQRGVAPTVRHLDGVALREHRVARVPAGHPTAAAVVGCGPAGHGEEIVIADPVHRTECGPGAVGEIWVAGDNIAQGYLNKPAETRETFQALTSDTGRGPFLRTGDLGFLLDGELFVTGRLKDLVIIRGRNYYPNDIEATVQETHPALMSGRGACFSLEADGVEQLAVVQEVDRELLGEDDVDAVIAEIRAAVTAQHDIRAHTVVLMEPLRIPTTSSGKIRRSACRQRYLDGTLEVFAKWHAPAPPDDRRTPAATDPGRPSADTDKIRAWFVDRLALELGVSTAEIDTTLPFAHHGLDSVHAIQMLGALETWLGRAVPPTLVYEYPTIDQAAAYLSGDAADDTRTAPAALPEPRADEPIAIIGIGCRFPGADGPSAFWQLLCAGVDAVTETPPDRWGADVSGAAAWGGFLDRIDEFDAAFFGISPREAVRVDPQQRLLLEVAWEALEDGGQAPQRLAGSRTGVFTGVSTNDYQHLQLSRPELIDGYSGTGTASSIAANRLSYFFDFRGPSLAVDSACSSSLVAVHQACRSLRDGECELALAGGVNVMLTPAIGLNFSRAGVLAADGRCKAFDARADGWVRGEGAGMVVLKPLSRALADADRVYAVIRGSAVNQDGRTNGLMAPSRVSQEAVVAEAYRRAGVSPGAVQYVEAQGLGTLVGDAIEAQALGAVLSQDRPPQTRCLVGSVKTNIGHLEAAAGVAGLIKVALALHHRLIPPTLHYTRPNPNIPFADLPLRVADSVTSWPDGGGRATAGVSAFGFGGTNAHVVLVEAPEVRVTADEAGDDQPYILPVSAKSPEALVALAGRYESALTAGARIADLCHTAGVRRDHHDHRLAVVGATRDELVDALAAYRRGASHPGAHAGQRRPGQRSDAVHAHAGETGDDHTALATHYANGHAVDWARVQPRGSHCPVTPTYPWQRRRFWLEPAENGTRATPFEAAVPSESLLGAEAMRPAGSALEGPPGVPTAALIRRLLGAAVGVLGAGRRRLQRAVPLTAPVSVAPNLSDLLRTAGREERDRLLESYLREQAASRLGLLPQSLDIRAPLHTLGLDSLMAAELRARVEQDLGIEIPVVHLLNGPSVAELVEWLGIALTDFPAEVTVSDTAVAVPDGDGSRWLDLLTRIPEVADDDVDDLLCEILAAGENDDDDQLH